MNITILQGRITKDIELRYNNETALARFTLAVDRKAKEKETDFIQCIAFGKTAELIDKYVGKGNRLLVKGRIQTGSYKKTDGATVYTTDIVVEEADFIEWKEKEQTQPQQPQQPQQTQQQYQQKSFNQASNDGFYQPSSNEGLPFR